MSVTVSNIQDLVNLYIGDTSTDSVSAADRLDAITEAVQQAYTAFDFDFQTRDFNLSYYDTINDYNITTDIPDFLEPVDLVREVGRHQDPFTRKSPREIKEEIDNRVIENSFAIERKERQNWLWINHTSRFSSRVLHDAEGLTSNGTWAVDAANSDATNLTQDSVEFKQGSNSLNFDVDVSQSGNDRATIENSTMTAFDLTEDEDLSSWLMWAYIPDATNFTSFTVYWGSDSSNYWSSTASTDHYGATFADEWNRVRVDWSAATKTSSPDVTAINYLRIDLNYAGGQGDDTDFRIDDIRMIRPETLTFLYQTWAIGETSTSDSTLVYDFTATTNVPFYSGIYDYVNIYVAHFAAAILFRVMGQKDEADVEERLAGKELERVRKRFPGPKISITRNFKVAGLNFNK